MGNLLSMLSGCLIKLSMLGGHKCPVSKMRVLQDDSYKCIENIDMTLYLNTLNSSEGAFYVLY